MLLSAATYWPNTNKNGGGGGGGCRVEVGGNVAGVLVGTALYATKRDQQLLKPYFTNPEATTGREEETKKPLKICMAVSFAPDPK